MTSHTQQDLEQICIEWQLRLRIPEWNVQVVRVPGLPLWGDITRHREKKNAILRVRDQSTGPLDHTDDDPLWLDFHDDEERTIVHELLHIVMLDFEPDDSSSLAYKSMEFAIHSLAQALVEAKRETV